MNVFENEQIIPWHVYNLQIIFFFLFGDNSPFPQELRKKGRPGFNWIEQILLILPRNDASSLGYRVVIHIEKRIYLGPGILVNDCAH